MPTRQFAFLIALAAMIATGVGLVLGSRTAPDEVRVPANSAARADVATPAGEDFGAPTTNSVSAPKTPSGRRGDAAATVDAHRVESPRATSTTSSGAGADSSHLTHAKDKVDKSVDAQIKLPQLVNSISPEAAKGTDTARTLTNTSAAMPPSTPVDIHSDYVFVNRSQFEQARMAADEAAAIASLHVISSAQAQFQSIGVLDTDHDGAGEYGYFGELAGSVPLRSAPGEARHKIQEAVLSSRFGKVDRAGNVASAGYFFRMYLPGVTGTAKTLGVPESAGGGYDGKGPNPGPENTAIFWSCFAWPIEAGTTGTRAFYLNQEGELLELANADHAYSGELHMPAFDAAVAKPFDIPADLALGGDYTFKHAWPSYQSPEPMLPDLTPLGPAVAADMEKYNKPDSSQDKIVVPRRMIRSSGLTDAERAVVANLREISLAQRNAKAAVSIDTDKDGEGEYGFFGELAGTSPCRTSAGKKRAVMKPAVLDAKWGKVTASGNVVVDGYVYRIHLPGPLVKDSMPGLSEAPGGGCVTSGPRPDHENAEAFWNVYAWPLEAGKTGQRVFFFQQGADVAQTANLDGFYSGEEHAPTFDAAVMAVAAGNMCVPAAIGDKSVDGRAWAPLP